MKTAFATAVQRYLRDREIDGYMPNTLVVNRTALNKAMRAVDPQIDVRRLDRNHVSQMIDYCNKLGNSDATINALLSTLGSFFRWCRDNSLMDVNHNPLSGRRYRKSIRRDHDMINLSEFPLVLDVAEGIHARERIYIALGLYTLLRQSEILSIRIKDVNLELNTLDVVLHKTKERDQMRIVPELRAELRKWLTYYTDECGPLRGDWYLVPTRRPAGWDEGPDGAMTIRRRDRLVPHIRPRTMHANVQRKHCGSHTLRRSAARALYEELVAEGVDDALRQVSAWLHHKSVLMTELYLGLTADRERRNRRYEDSPMYPSLQANNVVSLRSTDGQAHAAGM
jgi:integrase